MNKKLYVGNLLYEITDDELKDLFSQAGTVATASVIRYQDSGRSKGFAFIEMEDEAGAQKAIEMFHEQDYKGRKLVVSEARPPRPRTSFGGGDRGGMGGGRGPRRSGPSRGHGHDDHGHDHGHDEPQDSGNDMGGDAQ